MQAGSIGSAQPLRDLAGMLVSRPDEAMLALGAGGERQVAGLRALLAALLLSMPLASALSGAPLRRVLLLFAAALLLNTAAQALLAFSRRSRRHPWLPFASSSWDVTATTLVLVALGLGDWPAALNNVVAFCGYLLAIVLTALRNDGRVTLATGVLAIAQYGLLSMAALSLAGSPEELLSADHGAVQTGGQALRHAPPVEPVRNRAEHQPDDDGQEDGREDDLPDIERHERDHAPHHDDGNLRGIAQDAFEAGVGNLLHQPLRAW